MNPNEHVNFTVSTALLTAFEDYKKRVIPTEEKLQQRILRIFERTFGNQDWLDEFMVLFPFVYMKTIVYLEEGEKGQLQKQDGLDRGEVKQEIYALYSKVERLPYLERLLELQRFAENMLAEERLAFYFPEISIPGNDLLELCSLSTLHLFSEDFSAGRERTGTEVREMVQNAIRQFSEDDEQKEIALQAAESIYVTLQEMRRNFPEDVARMVAIINQEKNPQAGVKNGLIFMQEKLIPKLNEALRKNLLKSLKGERVSIPGIVPKGYDVVPECFIQGCENSPEVIGTILTFMPEGKLYGISIFSCQEHRKKTRSLFNNTYVDTVLKKYLSSEAYASMKKFEVTWKKDPTELRKRVEREKELLERYRLQNRLDKDNPTILSAKAIAGEKGQAFVDAFVDANLDLALKYELPETTVAFLAILPTLDREGLQEYLRSQPNTWMALEKPIALAYGNLSIISFDSPVEEAFREAQKKYVLNKKQQQEMHTLLFEPELLPKEILELDFTNEFGETIWGAGATRLGGNWVFVQHPDYTSCGNAECSILGNIPCEQCQQEITRNLSIFVNALRIIGKEFAVEDAPSVPNKKRVFESIRKNPDPERLHKIRPEKKPVEMHIVTINALQKKTTPAKSTTKKYTRGYWADMLRSDQWMIVPKHITLKQRYLKNERYWIGIMKRSEGKVDPTVPGFKGYPIDVSAHNKKVRVKVETLTKNIHVVEMQ